MRAAEREERKLLRNVASGRHLRGPGGPPCGHLAQVPPRPRGLQEGMEASLSWFLAPGSLMSDAEGGVALKAVITELLLCSSCILE